MTIVEKKDRIKAASGHLQLAPRSSRPAAQFGLRGHLLAASWCKTYRPRVAFRVRSA